MKNRVAPLLLLFTVFVAATPSVWAQTIVNDIFGRSLNQRGLTLVDWDGYMANPLIRLYFLPPAGAALPGYAEVTAGGDRFYFQQPSSVGVNGPYATFTFFNADPVPLGMSIFPAHSDADPDDTLTIVFTDAHNAKQTNAVPVHVIDQDTHHDNDLPVTVDFGQDATGFFTNDAARSLVIRAANDWTYYFADLNLDAVPVGVESTFIWSNDFNGGYYAYNTNEYTGYLLYAYGTTNDAMRSGGEGSYSGDPQSSGGIPLTMKRSGGFEANILGNYNLLGWLFGVNDGDWLATENFGDETNDFLSIAHHEIGHALIFNEAHPGFAAALANGYFSSEAVTNYYGDTVPIDSSNDHLTGVIDPESGQGAFGWEYYGDIPRYRWTMTKIDLLCAQEVGYTLRPTSAFAPFEFPGAAAPTATINAPFSWTLPATGGIPIYDFAIVSGDLPDGLALDRFTGVISGTPANIGSYDFTAQVNDYHEGADGLTQDFTIVAGAPQPPTLSAMMTNNQVLITVYGNPGDRDILEGSTNLIDWPPIVTNVLVTTNFQYLETNLSQYSQRFYRAVLSY